MNRLSRPSQLLALILFVALLASACGASEVVVSQGDLAEPRLEPSEPAPDTDESAAGGTQPADDVAPQPEEVEADQEQVSPEPVEEPDSTGADSDGRGSLSGVALLRQAAVGTDQGSYRFEVFFAMTFGDGSFEIDFAPEQPLSTGEVSGETQYTFTDLGLLFEEIFSLFGDSAILGDTFGGDLTVEMIVDGTTMYMRAPMFAMMADGPAGTGLPPGLGQLGDGWGVIDLASIPGFDAADLVGLTGGQSGSSPAQMVALLESVGSEVEDMGPATVRGVETTRLRAEVNVLAMMTAQGLDVGSLGGIDAGVLDFTLPLNVFVDGEERVRRVSMSLSLEDMGALLAEEDVPPGVEFEFSTTIDLFDFGADITIDLPDEVDIVGDFTDLFRELAGSAD